MTAPVESWTVPVIDPDVFCAFSVQLNVRRIRTIRHNSCLSPNFFRCIEFSSIWFRAVYTARFLTSIRSAQIANTFLMKGWASWLAVGPHNPRLHECDFDYDEPS